MNTNTPRSLSDSELVTEVRRLAGCERQATVRLILHLAELDARRLHLGLGHASLFEYCTEALRLSEHEAYNRIEAARALRRFPAIAGMLVEGSLTLTTVRLLAPHLTAENQQTLLSDARGKSKRQVEELLVHRAPKPDLPPLIRKLPERKPAVPLAAPDAAPHEVAASGATGPSASAPSMSEAPPIAPAVLRTAPAMPRPAVTPVSPERYQVRFTASAAMCEKLRMAQDLLRHTVPSGDPAEIFDRALTVLLEQLTRQKFAATARPRPGRQTNPDSRHIPAEVKRAVWRRDGGRCAFVAEDGHRCEARSLLEFHHVRPYGTGGKATMENVELRCRAHNAYEARLYYEPMRTGAEPVLEPEAISLAAAAGRSGTSGAWQGTEPASAAGGSAG